MILINDATENARTIRVSIPRREATTSRVEVPPLRNCGTGLGTAPAIHRSPCDAGSERKLGLVLCLKARVFSNRSDEPLEEVGQRSAHLLQFGIGPGQMVRQASGPHRKCTPCLTQNHPRLPRLPGGIMSAKEMLQTLGTSIASTASVKSVFGDPIRADRKTIVPVAQGCLWISCRFWER